MARITSAIGLDIGHRSLKLVRMTRRVTGPAVIFADMLMLPEGGQGLEPIVHRFLESHGVLHERCGVCVSGRSVMVHVSDVPFADRKARQQFAQLEARRMNELAQDEIVSAYAIRGREVGADGVMVAMAQAEAVREALQVPDTIGLHVVRLIPAPVAVYRGVLAPATVKESVWLLADVGHTATQVVVARADRLVFSRRFEVGGLHFARALAQEAGLTVAQAEDALTHVGLEAGDAEGPLAPKLRKIMAAAVDGWVAELNTTLTLYRERFKEAPEPVQSLVISGGVAEMPGFRAVVAQKTRLRVYAPAPPAGRLDAADAGRFAPACGVAMAALDEPALGINLLPPERQQAVALRQQRAYWLWAGLALCLTLAVLLLAGLYASRCEAARLAAARQRLGTLQAMAEERQTLVAENTRLLAHLRFARRATQGSAIVQATLAALAAAKHPGDWVTLIADERSYFPAALDNGRLREPPEISPGRIIVEGYTPVSDYSTVLSMIEKLRQEPYFAKVDLLTDDRLVENPDRWQAWQELNANLFTIEIEVRRP